MKLSNYLVLLFFITFFLLTTSVLQTKDFKKKCTAIGISKKATKDGSVVTTHNNDCPDCDFRITNVPAKDWKEGSMRPIHRIHWLYPRYLEATDEEVYNNMKKKLIKNNININNMNDKDIIKESINLSYHTAQSSLINITESCPLLSYKKNELILDLSDDTDEDLSLAYSLNANNIHGQDYLRNEINNNILTSSLFSSNFSSYQNELSDNNHYLYTKPYAYIPQPSHTYSYILGVYGIQNEKGVSIAESTCGSIFAAKPIYQPGGTAVLHMETLIEIALERCDTARCAILLMGELAEKYGFTAGEFDGDQNEMNKQSINTFVHKDKSSYLSSEYREVLENGAEALVVGDKDEVWAFHIMSDETGYSAIWVAQKVKDEDLIIIANQFIIGEINENDSDNFLYSKNLFNIAKKYNFIPSNNNKKLNFRESFGLNFNEGSYGCTRRVWRVFTMASPSLLPYLSPYTDGISSIGYNKNKKIKTKTKNRKLREENEEEDKEINENENEEIIREDIKQLKRNLLTTIDTNILNEYDNNYLYFFKNSTSFLLSNYTNFLSYYYYTHLNSFLDPYPFSIQPDKPLSLSEIMRFTKDQYEGTSFSLTNGLDSGPFGDTFRHGALSKEEDNTNGVEREQFYDGLGFGRPISLWRTTYGSVTQSRSSLVPSDSNSLYDMIDEVSLPSTSSSISSTSHSQSEEVVNLLGPRIWIAPYAPHHSSFVPIYSNSLSIPSPLKYGSNCKLFS